MWDSKTIIAACISQNYAYTSIMRNVVILINVIVTCEYGIMIDIPILYIIQKLIFRHTLAKSATFAPGSETRMSYFRPGYDKISYTQHGDKEGHPRAHVCHPRLRLGWQFTGDMDCPSFFLPTCVIYYFPSHIGYASFF